MVDPDLVGACDSLRYLSYPVLDTLGLLAQQNSKADTQASARPTEAVTGRMIDNYGLGSERMCREVTLVQLRLRLSRTGTQAILPAGTKAVAASSDLSGDHQTCWTGGLSRRSRSFH